MGAIDKVRNQGAVTCWQASLRVARLLAPTYKPITTEHGFDTVETWECPAIIGSDLIPTMRSDLQALERFLRSGCNQDAAKVCLGQLAALTKSRGDMTAQAVTVKLNAMAAMLSEYPQPLVERACRQYALESTFFPALAELVTLIKPELARYESQRFALQKMIEKAEADAAAVASRADETPEQRAASAAVVSAKIRQLAGNASAEDLEILNAAFGRHGLKPIGPARQILPDSAA